MLTDLLERLSIFVIVFGRLLVEKLDFMVYSLQAISQLLAKRMLKIPVNRIYERICPVFNMQCLRCNALQKYFGKTCLRLWDRGC